MNRKRALVLIPALALTIGTASMALRNGERPLRVMLRAEPDAVNAGLENSRGMALLQESKGVIHISVDLGGASLPEGTVLEGWLVDAGLLGGPGPTSVSDDDERYGTPFGNATFDELVERAPYALSTGVLHRSGDRYRVTFHINNNLTPYDAVVVTLESDANGFDYDPRPGSLVAAGRIMR
jgi:hypothetical protein